MYIHTHFQVQAYGGCSFAAAAVYYSVSFFPYKLSLLAPLSFPWSADLDAAYRLTAGCLTTPTHLIW